MDLEHEVIHHDDISGVREVHGGIRVNKLQILNLLTCHYLYYPYQISGGGPLENVTYIF